MEGGPIGARCTIAASRLIMQDWSEGYEAILVRSGVRVDALRGYVDDGRQFSDMMIRGTRFNRERGLFTWREDWERKDEAEDLPDEVRMSRVCVEAMNVVNED